MNARSKNNKRNNQGFTMTELLAVIAILGITAALIFLNIGNLLRGFYVKEMDETAQEIYIAAQNHLSIAESMGFLEGKSNGEPVSGGSDTYYFTVAQGGTAQNGAGVDVSSSVLSQMLPFGSIDDTIRLGGSYVISYNAKTATVLDVFYRNPSGRYDNGQSFGAAEYSTLMGGFAGEDKRADRRDNYADGAAIIGWYGGNGAGISAEKLTAPRVRVENAERLNVKVWWPSATSDLMSNDLQVGIIIAGKTSGARTPLLKVPASSAYTAAIGSDDVQLGIPVGARVFSACLDDIASTYSPNADVLAPDNGHFAERFGSYGFIPGETVTISTFAYYASLHDGKLYQVARGPRASTNSLFASVGNKVDPDSRSVEYSEARIGNVRHLENLSAAISGYDREGLAAAAASGMAGGGAGGMGGTEAGAMTMASSLRDQDRTRAAAAAASSGALGTLGALGMSAQSISVVDPAPTHARQIRDLSWSVFTEKIGGANAGNVSIHALPAGNAAVLQSEPGTYMPVEVDFVLDYEGDNHRIADVRVSNNADAGIFGALSGGSLTNIQIVNPSIVTIGGDAGALASSTDNTAIEGILVRNETAVTQAAESGDAATAAAAAANQDAALGISASGNAGGLVGSISGGSVEQCAAAVYVEGSDAGGLAGAVSDTRVEDSYAGGHTVEAAYLADTAAGAAGRMNVIATRNAGGLIGTATNSSINYCYATSSANGAVAGGLVGVADGAGQAVIANTYAAGRVNAAAGGTTGTLVGALEGGAALGDGNRIAVGFSSSAQADGALRYTAFNQEISAVGNSQSASAQVADMFPDLASYRAATNADAAAVPYDPVLAASYGCRYPLPTIAAIDTRTGDTDALVESRAFLQAHFGDWPKMEVAVVNVR